MKYSILVAFHSHPIDEIIKIAEESRKAEVVAAITGDSDLDAKSAALKKIYCRGCGYGEAINKAFSMSSGDFLVIMNDDVIPEREFFRKIDLMDFDVLIPKVKDFSTGETESLYAEIDAFWYARLKKTYTEDDNKLVPGSIFAVRRDVFERSGMFDKDYFMYYEDMDVSLRLKRIGRLLASTEIEAFHKHSFSDSGMKRYYLQRNRLLFIAKNCKTKTLFLFALYLLTAENAVMLFQVFRQKSILPLKARIDFFRMLPLFLRKRDENTR